MIHHSAQEWFWFCLIQGPMCLFHLALMKLIFDVVRQAAKAAIENEGEQ